MNFKVETAAKKVSVQKNNEDIEVTKQNARLKGEYIVSTSGDEIGLSAIAKKFNMSLSDFKKMTGLNKDTLVKGQILKNIPHAKIPEGKGLNHLAQQSGMTLDEITKLNGLKKNYKPQKGEFFYIYPQQASKPIKQAKQNKTITQKEKPAVIKTATIAKTKPTEMKPTEIAKSIMNAVDDNTAAVSKEDFVKPFSQIKSANVIQVIKEYDKISPKESLINSICSEIRSPKDLRKDAVMTIYDKLAQKVGSNIATVETRQAFKKELDKEFGKFVGFVDTEKMDKIISAMIVGKPKEEAIAKLIHPIATNRTIVNLCDGKTMTASAIKDSADAEALKHNRDISRPMPIVDKKGNITADIKIYEPTNNGALNGKTIIINAGHGGYNPKNGIFDPGADAKDSNGKIIEEWHKNKSFTDKIIPKLIANGAKVIFMSGNAKNIMDAKEKYKDADLFVSIHCDSAPKNKDASGQNVIYKESSNSSKKLANIVEAHLEKHSWIDKEKCKAVNDVRGLGVLKSTSGMPSILIEAGFQSNKRDLANIESATFRDEFAKNLTNGVISYFKK